MSFKSIVENYKEHGLKYFTVSRAKIVIRSFIRKFTGLRIKEKNAIAFSEVMLYKSLSCPDCVQLGHCRVCKCPINELFVSMDVPCSDGKFPEFEVKRNWSLIFYELKKGRFKEALKTYKNKKSWVDTWNNFKVSEGIFFNKMEI